MILCRKLLILAFAIQALVAAAAEPLGLRGYYFTFSRVQTWPLAEWQRTFDRIHDDGGNLVILWIGGGFRSKKFPVTWQYNRDHQNIQADFVRSLIDYAHGKQMRVLLGFTPFSYDGVNQYALEHPELKAREKNGNFARLSGIHCWGHALNPSRPEAQRFMLDYVREMFFEFYPNADGLMIESSDYAICFCDQCQGHYYEREFEFVKRISDEVWRRKPEAMVLIYPHYFTGTSVPGFQIRAATLPFDPRWALFFTPHSAHIDSDLAKQAKTTIYWDSSPALRSPRQIQQAAQTAATNRMSGYVPSFEGFSFPVDHPEGGELFQLGKLLKPFGFDWLPHGRQPYDEPLARVNRIAYREFTRQPDLPYSEFQQRLQRDMQLETAAAVEDLLFLQESFFLNRSWFSASPLVSPAILQAKLDAGAIGPDHLRDYARRLARIDEIAARYADAPGRAEVGRLAKWIQGNWSAAQRDLLSRHLQ